MPPAPRRIALVPPCSPRLSLARHPARGYTAHPSKFEIDFCFSRAGLSCYARGKRPAGREREESMVTTTVSNSSSSSAQRDLKKQLIELANAQFTSPEYQRLFRARFT